MLKLRIGYPRARRSGRSSTAWRSRRTTGRSAPVMGTADVLRIRELIDRIYVDDKIKEYVVSIVFGRASRRRTSSTSSPSSSTAPRHARRST